jgi:hypothetical protein
MAAGATSGGSGALARQYVEFIAKGLQELQDSLDGLKANLSQVEDVGKAMTDAVGASMQSLRNASQNVNVQLDAMRQMKASGELDAIARSARQAAAEMRQLTFDKRVGEGIDEFAAKLDAAKLRVEVLRQMNQPISSRLGVDAAGATTELDAFVAKMKEFNAEARVLERPLKVAIELENMRDEVEQATVKLQALKQAIASGEYQETQAKLAGIRKEMAALKEAADFDVLKKAKGTLGAWTDTFKSKVGEAGNALRSLGGILVSVTERAKQAVVDPIAIGAATVAFQQLTQAARSWVNAGLAGTGHGAALSLQFELLSRQIAGVFVPTINLVIRLVSELTSWFRSLGGEQQAMIRRWVEAAAVMIVVSQVASRLSSTIMGAIGSVVMGIVSVAGAIITTVIPAITTLASVAATAGTAVAVQLALATAGISVLIGGIALAAAALASLGIGGITAGAGITIGTESGRRGLMQLWNALGPIIREFRQLGAGVLGAIGQALEQIGDRLSGMFSGIDMGPLRELARQLLDMLASAVPVVVSIANALIDVVAWIVKAGVAVVGWLNQFGGVKAILAGIAGTIAAVAGAAAGLIAAVAGPLIVILGALGAAFAGFFAIAGAAIAAIGYVLYRVARAVWPIVEAVWKIGVAIYQVAAAVLGPLLSAFGSLIGLLVGIGGAIFENWLDGLKKIAEFIAVVLVSSVRRFMLTLAQAAEQMANMSGLIGGIGGATQSHRLRELAAELRAAALAMNAAGPKGRRGQQSQGRTDVSAVGGNFEQAMDLFKRINEAAIKSTAEQQLAAQQETNNWLQQIYNQGSQPQLPGAVPPPSSGIVSMIERSLLFGAGGNFLFGGNG